MAIGMEIFSSCDKSPSLMSEKEAPTSTDLFLNRILIVLKSPQFINKQVHYQPFASNFVTAQISLSDWDN